MIDLATICHKWNLSPIMHTWTPETGMVHQTLLLKTTDGSYALRAYSYQREKRWRITAEQEIIAYVRAKGIPVLSPIPLITGETILDHEGRYYVLFPFATGYQVQRKQYTAEEVAAMGSFLAQLHQVLSEYPRDRVYQRPLHYDRQGALQKMEEIEAFICSPDWQGDKEEAQCVLAEFAQRRIWMAHPPVADLEHFKRLERQVIHGDYQETNLFFGHGRVSNIIDWDQAYVAPRAWEVVRTLHYALQLDPNFCRIFLGAYREVLPLEQKELDSAAVAYGWMRGHDLWQYSEVYLRGNERLRLYFQPAGCFVPFIDEWRQLQQSIL